VKCKLHAGTKEFVDPAARLDVESGGARRRNLALFLFLKLFTSK